MPRATAKLQKNNGAKSLKMIRVIKVIGRIN